MPKRRLEEERGTSYKVDQEGCRFDYSLNESPQGVEGMGGRKAVGKRLEVLVEEMSPH